MTMNIAANRLVTKLPPGSTDMALRNIKTFFRTGSYTISLGGVRVEYDAPNRPQRRDVGLEYVEIPGWLATLGSLAGGPGSEGHSCMYVFCYTIVLPSFLVCDVSVSLLFSISACLHSLTRHDV
jgi:hypothetical protein